MLLREMFIKQIDYRNQTPVMSSGRKQLSGSHFQNLLLGSQMNQIKHKSKMSRDEIKKSEYIEDKLMFADFLKCVLDFQLNEHLQFLKAFNAIFNQVDQKQHGILNENEFRSVVEMMDQTCGQRIQSQHFFIGPETTVNFSLIENEQEIHYLLSQIDPFHNNAITYSEVIQLLSSHMVPSENPYQHQSVPLLEKFSNL